MSKPRPKSSRELLGWLWRNYLHQHTRTMAVAMFFMFIEGSMIGAVSYMMQPMFDEIFVNGNSGALGWVSIAFLLIFTVRGLAGLVQKVLLARVSLLTTSHLRVDLMKRMIRQDTSFHQTHPPGYMIQRIQGDVSAVGDVWRSIFTGAGRDTISLFILIGVAINVDPIWTAIMLVGVPLMFLPIGAVQRYVRKKASVVRDIGASLAVRLDEVFHGITPIKLNRLEDYQTDRYSRNTDAYIRASLRSSFGTASITGLIDIMAGFGFMGVLLYGGSEIISGEKTVGQFMSFFTAIGLAFDPMRRLASLSGTWQVAAAAVERLKELMDEPIRLSSPDDPVAPPTGLPDIELRDVTLRYGEATVLNGLSLRAESGKTTALVGASGAGKSTIFNLLTRLVDPQSGTISVGGIDVQTISLDDLRDLYSVVSQEAVLFDESLRENILLGRKGISDADLKPVLDAAHVSDYLANLPDGLDTHVGPRGSALSGGQRQRVVIARALLRNTPILLLDEATSALDAQSEKIVQSALDKLAGGRTTLVIAHRLSTIVNADKIIVMDRGRVVDEGTHSELLERGGIYADLYHLQYKGGKTVIDPEGAAALLPHAPNVTGPAPSWIRRMTQRLLG